MQAQHWHRPRITHKKSLDSVQSVKDLKMSIFSDVPNERMSGREERKTAFAFAVETVLKIDASVLDGLVSEVAAADTTTLLN